MAEVTYTATCHTEGCGNAGHGIPMVYDDEWGPPHAVVCGVCAQPITDLGGLALATEAYAPTEGTQP